MTKLHHMKALIIDDENKARRLLETLLSKNCPELDTIYNAEDLDSGVQLIREKQPDIVFLDIEMPERSGLEIIDVLEIKELNFQIIFITAYNKYAIEAFKLNAVDYLLKPVDIDELKSAVSRAISLRNKANIEQNLIQLKEHFIQLSKQKLALQVPRGIIFINYEDILYFEADGMYTSVVLNTGKTEFIAKPLKHFNEQVANNSSFYKAHRSYVVNLSKIKEFNKKDGGMLIMENNKKISISKDKRDTFFELMTGIIN